MKLSNIDLLALQTNFMKQDLVTQGICTALEPFLQDISENIVLCNTSNTDLMPETVLDAIAIEKNIFWYDKTADIDVKRCLVETTNEVHRKLGTGYAIKLVFMAYGVTASILEWYNYNGEPYHYKIIVDYTISQDFRDIEGKKIITKDKSTFQAKQETPYLPSGDLLIKLIGYLPYLHPIKCVFDGLVIADDAEQNTYADITAMGTYGDLNSKYYWNLQYRE